jgi:hypothetical protein
MPTIDKGEVGVQIYPYWTLVLEEGRWSTPCPGHYPVERELVLILHKAGYAWGPVSMGLKNLAPTGAWTPDHPVCSMLLYQIQNPGHLSMCVYM